MEFAKAGIIILVTFASVIAQLKLGGYLGWYPGITLSVLVAIACVFRGREAALGILTALFFLNWQNGFAYELQIFFLIIIAAFLAHRTVYARPGPFGVSVITALGVILFHIVTAPSAMREAVRLLSSRASASPAIRNSAEYIVAVVINDVLIGVALALAVYGMFMWMRKASVVS